MDGTTGFNPSGLIFLALVFAAFYFIAFRPQKKRLEQHRRLVESIESGDDIITIGGIFGTVQSIGDDEMELEVADGVRIRIAKSAVARRVREDLDSTQEADEA